MYAFSVVYRLLFTNVAQAKFTITQHKYDTVYYNVRETFD